MRRLSIALAVWRTRRSWCRCGHPRTWHAHYRRGTDCSQCPCVEFRR